ncbi:hypothetical protein ACV1EH_17780, partial [Aeromonas caviae]
SPASELSGINGLGNGHPATDLINNALFLPYLCHDLWPCKEGECYFSVLAAAYFGGAEQGVERAINR